MNIMIIFLNPPIKEMNIYMKLLDNYKRDGFVVLLYKILYDLK